MVFYKIEAESMEKQVSREEARELANELNEKSENLYQKARGEGMIFTATFRRSDIWFAIAAKSEDIAKNLLLQYLKEFPLEIASYSVEEITFGNFDRLLSWACSNDFVNSDDEILERFELQTLKTHGSIGFGEAMIDENMSIEDCEAVAKKYLFDDTMLPELERISNSPKVIKSIGHPVHYMVKTDDRNIRKTVYKALLSALYTTGRIKNKRYAYIDFDCRSRIPGPGFDSLYRSSEGGVVVVRYTDADEEDTNYANRGLDIIAAVCETANKYKNKVLTVFCIRMASNTIKNEFLSHWGSTAFIELNEGVVSDERAKAYLKNKAGEQKIRTDKKLTAFIEEGKGYTSAELNRIFDEWYGKKLRNDIYSQYKTAETVKAKLKEQKPQGSSYDKLKNLIGLENAKEVMDNALNYFKAQKIFADRGMLPERPSMHMVFTGNPGTAKTTVARLFAEVMKENGLLLNGEIYEVGRADLVGKYVGSTAPLVKNAFARAKGGVLFIDEAYSLVDDRDGLFGDEAINTIVQEMENNRSDTVVIFAGYPDKMEGFLNKNPGLRSRIAFHIPFEDYSKNELCDIAKLIAAEKKLTLSEDALEKLLTVFEDASKNDDFGNGRFVRNIIEKAKMAQANRLMKMNIERITDEELVTITAEDIVVPIAKPVERMIKIGFSA
ncbi:MAG: AAA family ATPase [Clostridia bacterium]|nr:AAA family ATPase [Clostridia bacterium]